MLPELHCLNRDLCGLNFATRERFLQSGAFNHLKLLPLKP